MENNSAPELTLIRNDRRELRAWGMENWLFSGGLLLYLLTRLIQLDKFPIFFFTDEAVQTMSAVDLIARGMRDSLGRLFPVYFENGGQYNLSLSVYLQLLPALLPRSIWLTRGICALVTLAVPLSLGLALRDYFRARAWWLAPVFIAAVPAWFLHSRTAFETSLGASMFSLFLFFYLGYRLKNRRLLPLALIFGALAFYAYSPLQLVVVLTGLGLLVADWRYHLRDKRGLLAGFLTLALAALPYALFQLSHPGALTQHLNQLQSYWLSDASVTVKLGMYLRNYLRGLDPRYWFFPNETDLIRHQMKGMGHFPLLSLPLVLLGLADAARGARQPEKRAVLIALLAAPAGAALVGPAVTRLLVMIVPLSYLALLGTEHLLVWLRPARNLHKLYLPVFYGVWALSSLFITWDALRNGPTWFENYGMYGLQWGGKTLFDEVDEFRLENPGKEIFLSPNWANGTDVIARYFLGDPLPITVGDITPYTLYQLPLDKNSVFVMTPEEFDWVPKTGKFTDVEVLRVLPYPNGQPGFYFVSLRYIDGIADIFAREQAERRQPKNAVLELFGQQVRVQYSPLDINDIYQAFDGSPATLIRSFEANPLVITLEFPQAVSLSRVSVLVGNAASRLEIELSLADGGEPLRFSAETPGFARVSPLSVAFEAPLSVKTLRVSLLSVNEGEPAHVHLWELILE
ncbi:MAG: hypothetical protein LC103_01155 [Anaerolineales bacterium]|nr:hypothetical protein [Anaerolineales bacterium]